MGKGRNERKSLLIFSPSVKESISISNVNNQLSKEVLSILFKVIKSIIRKIKICEKHKEDNEERKRGKNSVSALYSSSSRRESIDM